MTPPASEFSIFAVAVRSNDVQKVVDFLNDVGAENQVTIS
jgi:hypothetical protein